MIKELVRLFLFPSERERIVLLFGFGLDDRCRLRAGLM